ncbi:MAG TPA: hypothetical protein VMU68_09885 [Acidimicrobiales bacterium]|nr:hypothetical protein [Acidimicrobiales bacterium]
MHTLRGHRAPKSADVYDNLIGHDIGVNTTIAPRTLSRPYETEPDCPLSSGHSPVGNGATKVRQASNAQFAERTLGPSSGPNPFESALSASATSFDVEVTRKGRRGP